MSFIEAKHKPLPSRLDACKTPSARAANYTSSPKLLEQYIQHHDPGLEQTSDDLLTSARRRISPKCLRIVQIEYSTILRFTSEHTSSAEPALLFANLPTSRTSRRICASILPPLLSKNHACSIPCPYLHPDSTPLTIVLEDNMGGCNLTRFRISEVGVTLGGC